MRNGARQVEVTMNGIGRLIFLILQLFYIKLIIGERAGNTSLEEVVMAINTHPAHYPVFTTIDTTQIYRSSRIIQ